MTDILNIKEIVQRATLWIPNQIKNAVSISIAFGVDILWKYNFPGKQNKKTV